MSKQYEEEHEHEHEIGEEHEHEIGHEHEEFHATSESDDAAAAAKKKKDKIFKASVIAVAVVVGGGLVANKFLFSAPPQKARSQFDNPSASGPKGASPFAGSPAQQTQDQQAQAILGGAPTSVMGPTGPTGPTVVTAPVLGANPAVVSAPAPMGAAPTAVGIGSASPVVVANPVTPETATALGASSASAIAVTGAATTASGAPVTVVAQVTPSPAATLDAPKDGVERAVSELSKKMDAIGEALKNFDGAKIERRLVSLEDRMSAMESGSRKPAVKVAEKNAEKADKPVLAQVSEKPRRVRHTVRRATVKRYEPARVENATLFTQNSVSMTGQKEEMAPVQKSPRDYTLQAVIPGRMWIKTEDGASHTFAVGDKLPDGSKVLKIDAERNRVQTSSGSLQ